MDIRIAPGEGMDGGDPGPGEMIIIGMVRLASLPFLLLVIVIASVIYGVASLARIVAVLAAVGFRRPGGVAPAWDRPVKAQDA